MSNENTDLCDKSSAIRDIADERHTLWRLDSWQDLEVVPHGEQYGHGGDHQDYQARPDKSVVFQYTLAGEVFFNFKGQVRSAPKHHAYIFPSNMEPRWKESTDPEYRSMWLRLFGAGLYEHWQLMRDVHGPAIAMDQDGRVMEAARDVITLHQQGADLASEALAIHGFVMTLYQHCERGQAEKLYPVQRAVQHIIRYPLHPHSLKERAAEFGVSREHLTRVFLQEIGMTPASWLRDQRYKRAHELLIYTNLSIKDVVLQSGMGSVDTFARLLMQREGETPSSMRAKYSQAGRR